MSAIIRKLMHLQEDGQYLLTGFWKWRQAEKELHFACSAARYQKSTFFLSGPSQYMGEFHSAEPCSKTGARSLLLPARRYWMSAAASTDAYDHEYDGTSVILAAVERRVVGSAEVCAGIKRANERLSSRKTGEDVAVLRGNVKLFARWIARITDAVVLAVFAP